MTRQLDLAELARRYELTGASLVLDAVDVPAMSLRVTGPRAHYPASMIKLPIAMALAALCAAGAYRLDDVADVDPGNMTANDAPSPFVPGYRATLGELARGMLSDSDNVATNVLIDVLGRETLTASCAAFGLRGTSIRRKLSGSLPLIEDREATGRNAHPAEDAALLLHLLVRDANHEPSWVLEALRNQRWNGKLSAGLGPGDVFAHKTGDTDEVSHDGGILTLADGRRFILVVYTALPGNAETDARFAAFAHALRAQLAS